MKIKDKRQKIKVDKETLLLPLSPGRGGRGVR